MPLKLDRQVKNDALIMDAAGVKQADIAVTLNVSIRTITRAKNKLKKYGDIEGGVQKRGPKSKLDSGMRNVIFNYS
jgi:transposase